MDAAYICRAGPNEELRWSLRSAAVNAGVRNVWIIGDAPDWYTGPLLRGNRFASKQRAVYDNVRILAEHPDLPDEVAVWNDDFFAFERTNVEMAWRCLLEDHIRTIRGHAWWKRSLIATLRYLRDKGVADPLSYELHRPFPIVRADMACILAEAANVGPNNPPQWRTLYGVLTKADGIQDQDGKLFGVGRPLPAGPWLSTSDGNVGQVMDRLEETFPEPSPWER